jgi:hypothetical protein
MKRRFYTIFDLVNEFKAGQEEETKLQRTIYIELDDRDATLDLLLDKVHQPLNCLKDTTILDADGKTEHPVLEIGFMATGERYGEIKAKLEMAGLLNNGKATEVKKKVTDDKK